MIFTLPLLTRLTPFSSTRRAHRLLSQGLQKMIPSITPRLTDSSGSYRKWSEILPQVTTPTKWTERRFAAIISLMKRIARFPSVVRGCCTFRMCSRTLGLSKGVYLMKRTSSISTTLRRHSVRTYFTAQTLIT